MTKDLTTGAPLRLVISFALPILAGLFLQQVYQFADAVVVGRVLGMDALAAVGAGGSIVFLLLGFTMGMTNGFAIPVSRAFGAGDEAGVRHAVAAGAILSAVTALALTLGGPALTHFLLLLLDTPTELLPDATAFLAVTMLGSTALVAFNFLSAIIRALGDSITPLIFLAAASLLNIALVIVFVGGLGLGVAGAAAATVVAQLTTVLACLVLIARRMPLLRPRRADWHPHREQLNESLSLGFPMGFQMSIIAIGALVLQYAINGLGTDAVTAFTAGTRVDQLAMTPFQAFGMAVATFVAQNRGAARWSRIRQGVRHTALLVTALAVAVGAACILWGDVMIRAFAGADSDAAHIIATAHQLLTVNGFLYVMLALLFVFRSALQGMGRNSVPTLSGVMELALRTAAALFLVGPLGFLGAVLAAPLAWAGALVPLWGAWHAQQRQLRRLPDGVPLRAATPDGAPAPHATLPPATATASHAVAPALAECCADAS